MSELTHQQKEHQRLAANRPTTQAEKDRMIRTAASNALNGVGAPADEPRIAATSSRLAVFDSEVSDPTCSLAPTDRAHKKLTVSHARVVGKDGQPRMITDLSTGGQVHFPIEALIKELFNTEPNFKWAERFPS